MKKIFNWVQRRLRFTHKVGTTEGLANGDQSASREDNAFSDVFGGWKGGILTIGTFGYGPLKDEIELQDETPLVCGQEPEKENESDFGMSGDSERDDEPLLMSSAACGHGYEGLVEVKIDVRNCGSEVDAKKERRTLAELFSADSEENERQKKKHYSNEGEIISGSKSNIKHGFSLASKIIGHQHAPPIQKLNRLMRRVLKRKIHPEMLQPVLKKCGTTTDSASLLSTQVADTVLVE